MRSFPLGLTMVSDSGFFRRKLVLVLCFLSISFGAKGQSHTHIQESFHMGSPFAITVVHEDKTKAWDAIKAAGEEIKRIENLISSWKESSQTSAINRAAGKSAVPVDEELFQLISRAQKVSQLSGGAFDISYASLDRIWKFDGSMKGIPTEEAIKQSVARIDYDKVILNQEKQSVFLQEEGMKIGFGAIGKGYAANRAKKVLQEMGISSGMVNAGGDLIAWGTEEDGSPWKIAVADPSKEKKVLAWLEVQDKAVVTSGDYERFVILEGKRYAHIIDPRSGWPVQGLKSVSIICPDAEIADALATTVFVLGKEKGLELVEKLRGIECIIITDENEIVTSSHLNLSHE
ncbi:MAG: FAD:protein FMN transferase [Bacteroidota bacterium]